MKYFLSTIADADFKQDDGKWVPVYIHRTAPVAVEYGLGLELAEFCISGNLDGTPDDVLRHFAYNRCSSRDAVLHGPYNEMFPHAVDGLVARAAYERYDFVWNLCREHAIDKIVLHANFVPSIYHPDWFKAGQISFWRDFLRTHNENITICLENVMEPGPSYITDIVSGVDDARLRMCLDVGHANLTQISPLRWLDKCSPYIAHYHIHNNNGLAEGEHSASCDSHLPPGCGKIDMRAFLDRAEILTPYATAAVECSRVRESAMWLKENGYI